MKKNQHSPSVGLPQLLFQKSPARSKLPAVGLRNLRAQWHVRKWSILSFLVVSLISPMAVVHAKEPQTAKTADAKKMRRPAYPGDDYIAIYVKLLDLGDTQKATLDTTVEKYAQNLTDAKKAATTAEGKAAYKSLMDEFMDAVKSDFTEEQRAILAGDREARKQRHMHKKPVDQAPLPPGR